MSVAVGHINIVVQDLEGARDFFVQSFGFKATPVQILECSWVDYLNGLPNCKAQYTGLTLDGSATRIELLQYLNPVSPPPSNIGTPNRIGYRHIGLNVDDIDAMYNQLSQQWHFLSRPETVESFNCKTVYFLGPEGILMQLTQPLSRSSEGTASATD